jgi:hypothetical protein
MPVSLIACVGVFSCNAGTRDLRFRPRNYSAESKLAAAKRLFLSYG